MAFKYKMSFWLKTIVDDSDDSIGVSILYSEPKVVRIPKISAHASG